MGKSKYPDDLEITPASRGGHNPFRSFGEFLSEVRKRRGMTRAGLAKLSGISPNTLAKYEMEGKTPTAGKLARLCLELRLDPRKALMFALDEGAGEWLDASPSIGGSYDKQALWHRFEEFVDDLDRHRDPITDPAISRGPDTVQQQLTALTGVVAQLARTVNEVLPRLSAQENGPDQDDPSRPQSASSKEAAPTASRSEPKRKSRQGPDR